MKADNKTEAAVRSTLDKLAEGYARRQIETVLSAFAPDPDVVMFGTGADEKRVGRAQIKVQAERDWAQTESASMSYGWTSVSAAGDVAWVLAELFELPSEEAAVVLDIEPGAFRKRLQRARERLGAWMDAHCGLVNALNACNCLRQIPVALEVGAVDPAHLQFANHPVREDSRRRKLDVLAADADAVNRAAQEFCCQPDFAAPATVLAKIRALLDSKSLRLLDA
jgi:ketosteroid isomerase-like protein